MNLTHPIYHDADKARAHLESLRWPNGPVCPHCGSVSADHYALKGKTTRPGLYKCRDCVKPFTVTVGTVLERSKIPLNKWVLCAHLLAASKKGYSSHQMHRTLGVTYKTAWFMEHRLREAMNHAPNGMLGGGGSAVEVDETFWGNKGKHKPGARSYHHQMKIVSLVQCGGEKRSFHVPNISPKTLRPILQAHIAAKTRLMTDEAGTYEKVGRDFASHEVVNHTYKEYARGDVTTNTVESSFALLKRGLVGTFHHVSEHHLQRYVNEFDFRWNTRAKLGFNDTQRAGILLKNIAGKRLTYY